MDNLDKNNSLDYKPIEYNQKNQYENKPEDSSSVNKIFKNLFSKKEDSSTETVLIGKAYSLVGWSLFVIVLIYVLGVWIESDLQSDIVSYLFTTITFLLGFLFGRTRN